MTGKLKIGIIGTGNIASAHLRSYQKNPNVEIYALCDLNEARVKSAAEKYGVTRTYTDMHEMLKLKELDAVSVCTWNSAHAPAAIAALEAGKHVLCEKPMATNAQDAEKMLAAAKKAGKLLMIGFVRRHGNECAILKRFVDSGYFGDIYYAKALYLRRNGNPGGWFGDKSRSGGGPLIDLGVHFIDLIRYLMGNPMPVSVYGAAFHKLGNRPNILSQKAYRSAESGENDICDVEDLATAMIRFDNGAVLQVDTSFSLNLKADRSEVELFGDKGGARLMPELEFYTELDQYMADVKLAANTAEDFNQSFCNQINHFVDCITLGTPCIAPAEDGVTLMRILDAAYQSAETGHEVVLPSTK